MQIHIIIETSLLLKEYSKPSLDPDNPTPISDKYICVVKAHDSSEITGLEKNEISFKKESVEGICFYVVSESANFDNPVILYNLKDYDDNNILEEFSMSCSEIETIIPERFNPLETARVNKMFFNIKSKILNSGKGAYGIHFGIFNYDSTALGYFEFCISLSID